MWLLNKYVKDVEILQMDIRYIAIDKLWASNAGSNWSKKKIDICYECYLEFEKWMDNDN